MSRIDIRHAHALSKAQARKAVEEVARKLQERFQVDYAWQGDALHFSRSGVDGQIEVQDKALRVHARLGLLAAMFKEPIEAEIRRVLKERF
ncbi:polyhydroxyalkanoic acid system family protein [Thermomonas sp.]|jgi:putative polyhydroxyalkanoate system protein|uniref:polyhydroxyalkanoic acid system family protein n=1 Tax=Thermomonas sp. TaxID=1971895 RepID=UPI003D0F205B